MESCLYPELFNHLSEWYEACHSNSFLVIAVCEQSFGKKGPTVGLQFTDPWLGRPLGSCDLGPWVRLCFHRCQGPVGLCLLHLDYSRSWSMETMPSAHTDLLQGIAKHLGSTAAWIKSNLECKCLSKLNCNTPVRCFEHQDVWDDNLLFAPLEPQELDISGTLQAENCVYLQHRSGAGIVLWSLITLPLP